MPKQDDSKDDDMARVICELGQKVIYIPRLRVNNESEGTYMQRIKVKQDKMIAFVLV